jgi:hypothetical protein
LIRTTLGSPEQRMDDVQKHLIELFGEPFFQIVQQYLTENQADFEIENQIISDEHHNYTKMLKARNARFKANS